MRKLLQKRKLKRNLAKIQKLIDSNTDPVIDLKLKTLYSLNVDFSVIVGNPRKGIPPLIL